MGVCLSDASEGVKDRRKNIAEIDAESTLRAHRNVIGEGCPDGRLLNDGK